MKDTTVNLIANSWRIDHIGHVVSDLQPAVDFYLKKLGFRLECEEHLSEQKLDLVFLRSEQALIELLCPRPDNVILNKFLKNRGPGLHHIAYRVPDVNTELNRLKTAGLRLIDKSARAGSRGTEVAFIHPQSTYGVLIELVS